MNYEIQIHDMDNLNDPLIVQNASSGSIGLQYEGSEDPDKPIDGSTAVFDMETLFGEDFKYGQYFTSHEKKYRVTWVIEATQEIVWRGFILPETFSEPYLNPLFYTDFEAVCGLGLLKGKELSDDFYSEEKTVIEVLSACLKLTKIDFDIYMAPAMYNFVQDNWNTIYLDMLRYEDEDKRPSAYKILEDILVSKLCKVYQCQSRWYIEGFNRRNLPKNKFYKYTIDGEFLGTQVIERDIKELKHFVGGNTRISMVPALGRLTVSQESPEVKIPKAIYKDDDLEWVPPLGLEGSFFPREWFIYGDWKFSSDISVLPVMRSPEYYLRLFWNRFEPFRPQNRIELRKRPYILKGTRVQIRIKARFKNGNAELESAASQENYDRGNYTDALIYKIKINENVIYSTFPGASVEPIPLNLNPEGRGEIQLDFITTQNGFLDIELWEPYGDIYAFTAPRLYIEELVVENLLQRVNDVISMVIDENSSITKDVELPLSVDIVNASGFALEPVRDRDAIEGRVFKVPVLYGYTLNGNNYAVIELKYAVLIEQYPTDIHRDNYFEVVKNFEVVYNINGTMEMGLKTEDLYTDGNFYVYVRPLAQPTTNRLDWLKWTDAVYGVEQKPYAQVVAEIYRRMFEVPRLKITGSTDAPYKYNDLIKFYYNGEERYFAFSNLEWLPTEEGNGISTFTAFEAFYEGVSVGNVPPYVNAGPDFYLSPTQDSIQITEAVANDPDGGVPDIKWIQISGDEGVFLSNSTTLNPAIANLSGNEYEFKITATDEGGISASDTMRVIRPVEYELLVDNFENIVRDRNTKDATSKYRLSTSPVLPGGSALMMDFSARVDMDIKSGEVYQFAVSIYKNGNIIYSYTTGINYYTGTQNFTEIGNFQMESGTDVVVEHFIWYSPDFSGTVDMSLSFTSITFVDENTGMISTPYPEITKNYQR